MRALYTIDQVRAIDTAAMATLPPGTLMQRAGLAAAHTAIGLLQVPLACASVLIIAGPGNNGGDALVAAATLAAAGVAVSVKLCGDPARLPVDALQAWHQIASTSVRCVDELPPTHWSLVIDGLFGIGLSRPIEGPLRALVETINQLDCPRLSLDIPSGLNADTGNVIGDGGSAVVATHTLTFIGDKPGLHTAAGRDFAGKVSVDALAIAPSLFMPTRIQLGSVDLFADALRPRRHDSHKGSYGDVFVLGGADGMTGAVLLAARAALHAGGGRVFGVFVGTVPTHDALHPELMCRSADQIAYHQAVIVAGPGLGTSDRSQAILINALRQPNLLVLDADALNLIAANPDLQTLVTQHATPVLMTPHPLEAARLLGVSTASIQSNRIGAARALAQRYRATIILKGSGTVIAQPDGSIVINPTGNAALATGGSGDVLSGVCGALLAQGWSTWHAALGAVWLHGSAADTLASKRIGPIGLTASELPAAIRDELNTLTLSLTNRASTFAAPPQS